MEAEPKRGRIVLLERELQQTEALVLEDVFAQGSSMEIAVCSKYTCTRFLSAVKVEKYLEFPPFDSYSFCSFLIPCFSIIQ